MKSVKRSFIYGWLILLFCGCSGKESKLCSSGSCNKESTSNKQKSTTNQKSSNDSTIAVVENESLVCTLIGAKLAERKEELQKEVFSKVKRVEEIETGYILSFDYDERFLIKMTDFVLTENKCCPFFTFEIKFHSTNDALLKITGPPKAKKMLKEELLLTQKLLDT